MPLKSLKSSDTFKALLDKGDKVVTKGCVLLVAREENASARLGIIASRKVGGAVQRNRAKRKIRAAFTQLVQEKSQKRDVVIICRKMLLEMDVARLTQDLHEVCETKGVF